MSGPPPPCWESEWVHLVIASTGAHVVVAAVRVDRVVPAECHDDVVPGGSLDGVIADRTDDGGSLPVTRRGRPRSARGYLGRRDRADREDDDNERGNADHASTASLDQHDGAPWGARQNPLGPGTFSGFAEARIGIRTTSAETTTIGANQNRTGRIAIPLASGHGHVCRVEIAAQDRTA